MSNQTNILSDVGQTERPISREAGSAVEINLNNTQVYGPSTRVRHIQNPNHEVKKSIRISSLNDARSASG
jgi:hypothetical protein